MRVMIEKKTPVLRFTLLPYYRRFISSDGRQDWSMFYSEFKASVFPPSRGE